MDGISSSVMTAAAITGLLALPIASGDVPSTGSFSANEDAPVEMKTETSSESFVKTVSTAFDKFKINISGNQSYSILEKPEFQIETFQEPGKTERILETSTGTYRVVEASNKRIEEVKVPEGELVKKVEDGKITTYFDGINRSKVESLKNDLRKKYEESISGLESRHREMSSSSKPEIDVSVQPDSSQGDGEYIELENLESKTLDIEDWRIEDEAGNEYTFNDAEIEENSYLRVYTSNESKSFNWDTNYVWNENGDTAYIYDSEDNLVEEYSY